MSPKLRKMVDNSPELVFGQKKRARQIETSQEPKRNGVKYFYKIIIHFEVPVESKSSCTKINKINPVSIKNRLTK